MGKKADLSGKYGSWCLVAGAAEGLGRAFSMELAGKGLGVILVDRNRELMETLADELEQRYEVPTRRIHLDLASEEAVAVLTDAVRETACRLLIYNAAFSKVQPFRENTPEDLDQYIRVNTRTPLQLVHAFSHFHAGNTEQRKGIILMTSLAGSWGTLLLGPYGATKAFNHILAESLYHELKEDGFDILACIAGATSTPGYLASNPHVGNGMMSVMKPEKVVKASLSSLGRSPFVVPGLTNKLTYFMLTRILPRRSSLRIMNRSVGKLYREKLIL